ncbi:MAG: MFS transporter [Kiritimatiellae bacterium]|nr:MFS transporter [Kiritimatiellia bacterium]
MGNRADAEEGRAAGSARKLRGSLSLITIAGCLAMVYVAGTASPAFVEFMRALGATDGQFGLLGGIPLIMLAMQFAGAVLANVASKRKPLFMALAIAGRFLYVPLALGPALFPGFRGDSAVWFVLVLIALVGALTNITTPLWLSWMADLIPRRILNTYWGRRQRWMYVTWTVSFVAVAAFTSGVRLPITAAFPILAVAATAAGMADIALFIWVREPPNALMRGKPVVEALLAPLRSAEYRPFVIYSCVWAATVMSAAAFMQLYVLKVLGLTVWQTTLLWCAVGVGLALASSFWGRLADRHGHRPILTTCMGLKSLVVLGFLLATPRTALWLLPPFLLIDSVFEAGMMLAANGYMLKIAPRQNRSMFIAAITGLAGICGGLGAMAGGVFLDATAGFSLSLPCARWTNYHLLFALNVVMRLACISLAFRVREPKSDSPEKLLHVLRATWPMRFLLFPVGMYRRLEAQWTDADAGPSQTRADGEEG